MSQQYEGYQLCTRTEQRPLSAPSTLQSQKHNLKSSFSRARKLKYGEQKYRFKDLETTTFDAFLFCTCSVVDTSMSYEKGVWLQFFFALGLQIVAVVVQMGLVLLLYSTVVEELESPYEHGLQEKIESLTDALENNTILDKSDPSLKLCRKDHTLLGVHFMVLWIWISRMLREVTYAVELIVVFWRVDAIPSFEDPEQKHELRFYTNGGLCEPMNKARFLKQGKPKNATDAEKDMSNIQYWNDVMKKVVTADGIDIKATELRQDLTKLWSNGDPMTLPDLYDEMEGVVNGLPRAQRPTAEEFREELEKVWSELDKVPYVATEIIDEDVVLDAKGEIVNEAYTILYLTPFLRGLFIVSHAGLQIILAMSLMFVSAKFLILSINMKGVILKAVSMQFIMTLDALIFSAFIPTTFAKKVKSSKIAYAGERPSPAAQWSMSVAYLFIAVSLTVLLRNGIFGTDTQFRSLCRDYYVANPDEWNIPMDILTAISEAFGEAFYKPIGQ